VDVTNAAAPTPGAVRVSRYRAVQRAGADTQGVSAVLLVNIDVDDRAR